MPDTNLLKLTRKNLVGAARAAIGSRIFQHYYVRRADTKAEVDVAQGGEFSSALFVSGLLAIFGLIDRSHATVDTTLLKMAEAGWYKIPEPKVGCVVYWPVYGEDSHLGIFIGDGEYVSNSAIESAPVTHGPKLTDGRVPEAHYWHAALDQE